MVLKHILFIRKLYYISISWDTRAELKRCTVALAKLPWVVTSTIYSIIILQRIANPIECVILFFTGILYSAEPIAGTQ